MSLVLLSSPPPLAQIDDVRQLLGASAVPFSDDPVISSLIRRMSAAALRVIGCDVLVTTQVQETLNGNGKSVIQLGQGPVQSVASLTVNGLTFSPRVTAPGPGYINDDRFLYLSGGGTGPATVGFQYPWGPGFVVGIQNVVVQYTAGYPTVPMDVNSVVVNAVSRQYKNRQNIGVSSKDLAGERVSFTKGDFTADEIATLQHRTWWLYA